MITNLDNISDKELLAMLQDSRNAERAFAEIYSRYSRSIWAYCLKIIGNKDDTNDVFQEVFVKFYNAAKNEKINENIKFYLFSVARNQCLNYKRDKREFVNFDNIEDYFQDQNLLEKEILENESQEIIAKALDTLPLAQREIFILKLYNGLSYQEISDITGNSLAVIKNTMCRAKEKLRVFLNPYFKD